MCAVACAISVYMYTNSKSRKNKWFNIYMLVLIDLYDCFCMYWMVAFYDQEIHFI
jgi:hypothetical protein